MNTDRQEQVRALGRLGWSLRRIQDETGVHRDTARGYLVAAGITIREPRRRRCPTAKPASDPTTGSEPNPASEATPDREPPRPISMCDPYRDEIVRALETGRNLKSIWQDLVGDHGFVGSYESVKRFARKLEPDSGKVAHPRIETPPGLEAQVDYGEGPMVRHPDTGKHRRTRLFAMTLGYSRRAALVLAWKSSSRVWCELHERAFRRFGGVPQLVVLDNLKEGVLKPDVYDPTINPLYRDVLAHYGALPLPARVRHPDRKGKVESTIGYAQKTPLRGRRFETLDEAQRYLDAWSDRWADTRIRGTTKQQVAAMFETDKPFLRALPAVLRCQTRHASLRRAIRSVAEWCRRNRHLPVARQHAALTRRLRGHFNYFGVSGNFRSLKPLVESTKRSWFKWLRRRSQRTRLNWPRFTSMLERYPLPRPRISVNIWGS